MSRPSDYGEPYPSDLIDRGASNALATLGMPKLTAATPAGRLAEFRDARRRQGLDMTPREKVVRDPGGCLVRIPAYPPMEDHPDWVERDPRTGKGASNG